MNSGSSIYARCPACQETTLIQTVQASIRCAACNFDYTTLARDDAARERWMLETLRTGPMGQLAVIHLHRLITQLPLQESNAAVIAFAQRHGIQLPTGKPTSPAVIAGVIVGGFALLMTIVYFAFVR